MLSISDRTGYVPIMPAGLKTSVFGSWTATFVSPNGASYVGYGFSVNPHFDVGLKGASMVFGTLIAALQSAYNHHSILEVQKTD